MANPGEYIMILVDNMPVLTQIDEHGVQRFRKNSVIRHLVDSGMVDLNTLVLDFIAGKFSGVDYQEFYQGLGYSVCGFDELFGPGSAWVDNGNPPVKIFNPLWIDDAT